MVTLVQLAAVAAILAGLLLLSSATECQVSSWNPWSPCLGSCLLSMRTRNRDVLRPPFPEIRDGKLVMEPCPSLYQVQQCLIPSCPANGTEHNFGININSETFNNSSIESIQQLMNHLKSNASDLAKNFTLESGNDTLIDVANKLIDREALNETLQALQQNTSSSVVLETRTTIARVDLNSSNHQEEIKKERIQLSAPSHSPPGFAKPLSKVRLNTSTLSSLKEHESLALESAQAILSTAQSSPSTFFNFPFDFEENEQLTTKSHSHFPVFDLDLSQPNEVRPQLQFVAPPAFPLPELAPRKTLPPAEPPPPPSVAPVEVVTVAQQTTSFFQQNAPPIAPSVFLNAAAPGNAPPAFPTQPVFLETKEMVKLESNPPLFTALFPDTAVSEPLLLPPLILPQPPTTKPPQVETVRPSQSADATLKPGIPIVLPRPKPAPFARPESFALQTPSPQLPPTTPEARKNFVLKFADVQLPKPGNFILFAGLPTKHPINRQPDFADLTLDDFALPVPKPFPVLPVPKPFPISSLNVDDETLQTPNIIVEPESNKAEDDLFSEINYLDDRDVPIQKSTTLPPSPPTQHAVQQQQQQQQAKLLTWPSLMLNSTKSVVNVSTAKTIINVTDLSKIDKITSSGPKIYSRTPHLSPTSIPPTLSFVSVNEYFVTGSQPKATKSVVSNELKAVLKNETSELIIKNLKAINSTNNDNSTVNVQSVVTSTYRISDATRSHSVVLLNQNFNAFDDENNSTVLPKATSRQNTIDGDVTKGATNLSQSATNGVTDSLFKNAEISSESVSNDKNASTDILVNVTNFITEITTESVAADETTKPLSTLISINQESNKVLNTTVDAKNYTVYEYYETTLDEDYTGPLSSNNEIVNAINVTNPDNDGVFDLFSDKFINPTTGFIPIHTLATKRVQNGAPNIATSITNGPTLRTFDTTSASPVTTESRSNKSSRRAHGASVTVHSQLKNEEFSSNQTPLSVSDETILSSINKRTSVSIANTPNVITSSVGAKLSTKPFVYTYRTLSSQPTLSNSSSASPDLFVTYENFWRNRTPTSSPSVFLTNTVPTGRLSNEISSSGDSSKSATTENTFSSSSVTNGQSQQSYSFSSAVLPQITPTPTSARLATASVSNTQSVQPITFISTVLPLSTATATSSANLFKQVSTESAELETATVKFGRKNEDNADGSNANPFQSNWPSLSQLRHSSTTQELEPPKKIVVQSDGKEIKNVTEIIRLLNQLAGVQVTTTTEAAHYPCSNNYGNKRCCRNPTRFKCPDGKSAQMVMRWYRVAGQIECSAYNYGYCGLDTELQEQPIKFEQECYNLCYSDVEKQNLPIFKEIHFDQGFRINQQNPFKTK